MGAISAFLFVICVLTLHQSRNKPCPAHPCAWLCLKFQRRAGLQRDLSHLMIRRNSKMITEQKVRALFNLTASDRQIVSIDAIALNAKSDIYEKILTGKMKTTGQSRNQV